MSVLPCRQGMTAVMPCTASRTMLVVLKASQGGPSLWQNTRVFVAPSAGCSTLTRGRSDASLCAATKGFGAERASAPAAESCPCGSKSTYKVCCQPYHDGAVPLTVETALRARFSAFAKKQQQYLLDTFHDQYHVIHCEAEPGGAFKQLKTETAAAAKNFKFSQMNIRSVEHLDVAPGVAAWSPNGHEEAFVTFTYASQSRAMPVMHVSGTKMSESQIERSRFVRERAAAGAPPAPWRLISYEMIEWPVWLASAKDSELSAKERAQKLQLAEEGAAAAAAAPEAAVAAV